MSKVDFTGVSTGYDAVPEDEYQAAFTSYRIENAKASGQPMVVLEFAVTEGEYAGRKFWQNHSLQPQALFALKGTMLALGCDEETLEGPLELEDELDDLIGSDVRLEVGQNEYEGKMRNRIEKIKAISI